MFVKINLKLMIFIFLSFFFSSIINAEEIFLSLKKNKVNVRYGPSFESPIKFVYNKINLPIKQIDKKENWRRIIDFKNNGGWIHWSQLKSINSIIPLKDKILYKKPSNFSKPLAKIKKGRVLIVQKCVDSWCKIKTGKFKGWIKTNNIWGQIN
jgi:SH3-like domain-containing protein